MGTGSDQDLSLCAKYCVEHCGSSCKAATIFFSNNGEAICKLMVIHMHCDIRKVILIRISSETRQKYVTRVKAITIVNWIIVPECIVKMKFKIF